MFFLTQTATYLPYLILAISSFIGIARYSTAFCQLDEECSASTENQIELEKVSEQISQESLYVIDIRILNKYSSTNQNNLSCSNLPKLIKPWALLFIRNCFPPKTVCNSFFCLRPPPACWL